MSGQYSVITAAANAVIDLFDTVDHCSLKGLDVLKTVIGNNHVYHDNATHAFCDAWDDKIFRNRAWVAFNTFLIANGGQQAPPIWYPNPQGPFLCHNESKEAFHMMHRTLGSLVNLGKETYSFFRSAIEVIYCIEMLCYKWI